MLGLDTNVLVRFLVRDHEAQFERARRLIKREVGAREKVLVSLPVLLETEWVLRSRYGLHKQQIVNAVSGLLDAAEIELEDEPAIEEALYHWKDSAADFADCLIGARHRRLGCRATATFDATAVKVPGLVAG
ncbi:MAG: type II toxin-antitoxin system VapC family toxin [Burkholderiales bacterium]|nr:type II toxin-antitoxin system VapC family toxin [Burkholderiales bacterium]